MEKIVTGILAHVDAGKTTLSESLLFEAGNIRKMGRVDSGDAFLDTDIYEKERGITILSKVARLNAKDHEFILVDTPGHVDFSAEMERVLTVLDEAILLINATDGVQAHTKTVWKLLRNLNIPTFIFVNKMDLPDVTKEKVLDNLKKELSPEVVDFSDTTSDDFFENLATGSEALLDSYMESGRISLGEIKGAIKDNLIFPVYFGSALKNVGVKEFLEGIDTYSDSPKYLNDFGAHCFKITKDRQGNRLTHLKITGGTLKVKDSVNGEKVNEIRLYSGEKYESVAVANAGDICTVTGLKQSFAGSAYGAEKAKERASLEPVLTYAVIYPKEVLTSDMHKMLMELEEEEPSLNVTYDEGTKELYVNLFGEVQTEILTKRIADRFGVEVSFGTGKVLYKETIESVVEGVGHFEPLRHYAEVHLKMEPLPNGSGLLFETDVNEDDLALNWQRLILTHLQEREHRGVLTGSPITDIKFTLVAGKAHLKHTEGGDFRQATYRAVRQGLMMADSVLLEPFYYYELVVPDSAVGKAMTDIDRMWGTSVVSEQLNGESTITGRAPVSTLNGYAKDVFSYTKGQGRLSVSLAGYEPCHNASDVIAARMYNPENDFRNPCDSVFCSHGSGEIIHWSKVYEYMHLPLASFGKYVEEEIKEVNPKETKKEIFVTTEEIDEIINKTAYANKNGRKGSYKGISEKTRERNRIGGRREEKPVEYVGTKEKKKIILIDGYNVVHAWKELASIAGLDMGGAAGRLMDIVSNYSGITGIETILVFDAYKVPGHKTEELDYHNIKVVYTKTAETADHYIERFAHEHGKKYDVMVITSDGVEQVIIRGEGCRLMSSREFEVEYERLSNELGNINLGEGVNFVK